MTHSISNSLLQKVISLREGICAASCYSQCKCGFCFLADVYSGCSVNAECASRRREFEVAKQLSILQQSREEGQRRGEEYTGPSEVAENTTIAHKGYKEPQNNSQQWQLVCTENIAKANQHFSEKRIRLFNEPVDQRVAVAFKHVGEQVSLFFAQLELHSIVRCFCKIGALPLVMLILLLLLRTVAHATSERVASTSAMVYWLLLSQLQVNIVNKESVVNTNLSKTAEAKESDKYGYVKQNQHHKKQQCVLMSR